MPLKRLRAASHSPMAPSLPLSEIKLPPKKRKTEKHCHALLKARRLSFVDQPSGEIEERSTDPSSAEGRDFSGFADISDEAYTAQPQVGSSSQGPSPSPMKILKWKHWTPHMLLVAITREYEREEPCPPERFCGLESYQKQSLAFMIDVEKSRSVSGVGLACRTCDWSKKRYTENVRGGWLADDVGMDNRAVCIALVVANRSNAKQVGPEQWTPRDL